MARRDEGTRGWDALKTMFHQKLRERLLCWQPSPRSQDDPTAARREIAAWWRR